MHPRFRSLVTLCALLGSTLTFVGCALPKSATPQTSKTQLEWTIAQQTTHGSKVYANQCARCHGGSGQGSRKAPLLVGKGALPLQPRSGQTRQRLFHTALDVALFATQAMPPSEAARAELTNKDHWAVLAFALTANGVALDQPVTPNNAASIVLN